MNAAYEFTLLPVHRKTTATAHPITVAANSTRKALTLARSESGLGTRWAFTLKKVVHVPTKRTLICS